MSDDPFAKMRENWKKGWEKVQNDWNKNWEKVSEGTKKLFNPKKSQEKNLSPEVPESIPTTLPEELKNPPVPVESPVEETTHDNFQSDVAEFRQNVSTTLQNWQNQWETQFTKWRETSKQRNAQFKAKIS